MVIGKGSLYCPLENQEEPRITFVQNALKSSILTEKFSKGQKGQ
jgi:hypothetical protein